MITPGAVVGDVDALLALGVGLDEGAIALDDRLGKELGGLLGPDPQPRLIDGVHQGHDIMLGEAAAEIPGGGGVGDPHGAQGVEIDLVVAPQLEVFDPFAAGQDIVGDVQDMVGFVIRQMPFEEMEIAVDIADQPGPASQQVHGTDATRTEALDTIGQLVMDVGGGHHRLVALRPGPILDAFENSPLAFVEDSAVAFSRLLAVTFPGLSTVAFSGLIGDSSTHSKTSVVWNSEDVFPPPLFQNLLGFSSLF